MGEKAWLVRRGDEKRATTSYMKLTVRQGGVGLKKKFQGSLLFFFQKAFSSAPDKVGLAF
jgi:hypothetical protein